MGSTLVFACYCFFPEFISSVKPLTRLLFFRFTLAGVPRSGGINCTWPVLVTRGLIWTNAHQEGTNQQPLTGGKLTREPLNMNTPEEAVVRSSNLKSPENWSFINSTCSRPLQKKERDREKEREKGWGECTDGFGPACSLASLPCFLTQKHLPCLLSCVDGQQWDPA